VPWSTRQRVAASLAAAFAAVSLSACGQDDAGADATTPPYTPSASITSAGPETPVLTLQAEGLSGALATGTVVPDTSGRDHDGVVRTSSDAVTLTATTIEGEAAIQFPAPCRKGTCPKAVIEVASSIDLIPGVFDFAWGGRVLLTPAQTSEGSNILQKGFANGGGAEWKLQVDGAKGNPSCTLVGRGDSVKHLATSKVSVADGRWHDITCQRIGEEMTVEVDGVRTGKARVPADLVVSPEGDVRVGGKNVKDDNDQFFGAVATVFARRP
jgi:hypothetical protein